MAVIERGEPLVMFPEGTRQSGPEIAELFDGPAYVACRTGAPIVPVGMGGTEAAMPKGSKFLRPVKMVIVIGRRWSPLPQRERSGLPAGGARAHRGAGRGHPGALRRGPGARRSPEPALRPGRVDQDPFEGVAVGLAPRSGTPCDLVPVKEQLVHTARRLRVVRMVVAIAVAAVACRPASLLLQGRSTRRRRSRDRRVVRSTGGGPAAVMAGLAVS